MTEGSPASPNAVLGAHNLLRNCGGAEPGDVLLILYEATSLGMYGPGLVEAASLAAKEIGLDLKAQQVPFLPAVGDLPAEVTAALAGADHALFFARLGDQMRFRVMPGGARPIVCYALDCEMLGSDFRHGRPPDVRRAGEGRRQNARGSVGHSCDLSARHGFPRGGQRLRK